MVDHNELAMSNVRQRLDGAYGDDAFVRAEKVEVTSKRKDGHKEIVKVTDVRRTVKQAWMDEAGALRFELLASSEFATAKPSDVVKGILGIDTALDRLTITKTAVTFATPAPKAPGKTALPVATT